MQRALAILLLAAAAATAAADGCGAFAVTCKQGLEIPAQPGMDCAAAIAPEQLVAAPGDHVTYAIYEIAEQHQQPAYALGAHTLAVTATGIVGGHMCVATCEATVTVVESPACSPAAAPAAAAAPIPALAPKAEASSSSSSGAAAAAPAEAIKVSRRLLA